MSEFKTVSTPWGFTFGPMDASISIVIVSGQHGDELTGHKVGLKIMEMLGRSAHCQSIQLLGPNGLEKFGPIDLSGIRVMCVPGLNMSGLAFGNLYLNQAADQTVKGMYMGEPINLNRCWPDRHALVRPVWEAIGVLPGRVHVIDVHGSYMGKHFVYATENCVPQIKQADPELEIKPSGVVAPEEEETTLEGAAVKTGFWACTVEVGEDTAHAPLFWCRFIASLIGTVRRA